VIDRDSLTVITATPIEARAARRELPGVHVHEAGVALVKLRPDAELNEIVISCGVAGGLHHHHPTGTVIIPTEVRRPDHSTFACDPQMVEALGTAARRLGLEPIHEPLYTSATLVRGEARGRWSGHGYAAVDMETGLLNAPRVAAVRVILDTPMREISDDWLRPALALTRPANWPEAIWLAREAPRCARLAARVIGAALAR
jgi:Phosphorylase superfamily